MQQGMTTADIRQHSVNGPELLEELEDSREERDEARRKFTDAEFRRVDL